MQTWTWTRFGWKMCRLYNVEGGDLGQNDPLGRRTFPARAKIPTAQIYEEDCILCACVFHALCGHFSRACFLVRHGIEERLKILGSPNQEGKWKDDERPLREKHFFHCVRATSRNEITKMKGANLPLISFSKTSKWKHTEFENGNLHIICTLSTNSIYTNSDLNFRIGGWWSSQFWQCQNFESSSYWNMSLMMKKCSRTY